MKLSRVAHCFRYYCIVKTILAKFDKRKKKRLPIKIDAGRQNILAENTVKSEEFCFFVLIKCVLLTIIYFDKQFVGVIASCYVFLIVLITEIYTFYLIVVFPLSISLKKKKTVIFLG